MKIGKGKQYRCINDVVMVDGVIAYIKGKVYVSEQDECITDEQGCKCHFWGVCERTKHFFEEIGKSKRSNTYTTPKKIDLKERRLELVKAAMQGLLANSNIAQHIDDISKNYHRKGLDFPFAGTIAVLSIETADAVIAKLKEE